MKNSKLEHAKMIKKVLQALLCALIALPLASCQSLVESQIRDRLQEFQEMQADLLDSEKMHVILLGTGGPLSNETRDTSGVAIIAGGEFILVDVGPGIVKKYPIQKTGTSD